MFYKSIKIMMMTMMMTIMITGMKKMPEENINTVVAVSDHQLAWQSYFHKAYDLHALWSTKRAAVFIFKISHLLF